MPSGSNPQTKSLPHRIISTNRSGKSIVLRTIFCILFFLSNFTVIGVYYFVDYHNNPSSRQRIALLSCLSFLTLLCFAGTVLPWEILLYPFKKIWLNDEEQVEVQAFSYLNNLEMLAGYDAESDGVQSPSPLMKRTFTVLKTALRPTAHSAAGDSFRVIHSKTDPPSILTTPRCQGGINPSSTPPSPLITRVASLGSRAISRQSPPPPLKRSASMPTTSSRQRSGSNRSQRLPAQQILRITHPMESTTVHQSSSRQSPDHNYVSPSIPRRHTGPSERPSRLEAKMSKRREEKSPKLDVKFDWDPEDGMLGVLKRLDRLSTVGEGADEASPPHPDPRNSRASF